MIATTLRQLAAATGGRVAGDADVVVDAVAHDSRAMPGGAAVFIALRGEHADGHAFVHAAVDAGARALLVEREPDAAGIDVPFVVVGDTWRALRDLAVDVRARVAPTAVAVTGSIGKTTVKDLTAAAVGAGRRTHAATGSYNNELGVPLTLLGLEHDTQVVVAEVGARHLGDIAELAPIVAPDVAVVTAVAPVHLELFGTIDDIARAKAELVDALGPGGTAVLNVADPRVAAMASRAPATISVGLEMPTADVHARAIDLDRWARPRAVAVTPWGETELAVPVAGRHQVVNALLALTVAGHLGVDLDAAAAAIAAAPVSPWRGEVVDAGGVRVLNDAYNANPTAVMAALDTLDAMQRTGRSVAVLGVMAEIGATSDAEHRAVGAYAAGLGIDRLVAVGPQATTIAAGAREAGMDRDAVAEVADAADATALLRAELAAGDAVLVKASRVAGLEHVAHDLVAAAADGEEARR